MGAERFAAWFEQGRKNLIGEFETLAVAIALKLWSKLVAPSQVMINIDDEGATFALIRGYSDSFAISLICQMVAQQLDDYYVLPWYSRVPSASNLSDFPSRKIRHQLYQIQTAFPKGKLHLSSTKA